jgi:hypothetical protein
MLSKHSIWIDAVRIIQDCSDDWRRESAWMSDIYSGSFLDISASALSDVYGLIWINKFALMDAMHSRGEMVRHGGGKLT